MGTLGQKAGEKGLSKVYIKSDTEGPIACDSTSVKYQMQLESQEEKEWWLPGAGGRGDGEFLMGIISVLEDEKVLQMVLMFTQQSECT